MNANEIKEMKELIAMQAKVIKQLQKQAQAQPKATTKATTKKTKKVMCYHLYNPSKNTQPPKAYKNGYISVVESFKTNDKKITADKINELLATLKKSHQIIFKNRLYLTAKGYQDFINNTK